METRMDDRTNLDLLCIATSCVVEALYQSSAVIEPFRIWRNVHKGFSEVERVGKP
jgi:hypothetical protein